MSFEQARADLTSATAAHDAALESLRIAKVAFFLEEPTDKHRASVTAADNAQRATALSLERAEHRFAAAQREAAATTLASQRRRLDELNANLLARTARSAELLTALVDAERTAFALINEVERLMTEQANEFHERKSLAIAVGEPTPMRPAKDATSLRYELAALIKAAQIREGRDGYSNGQVSTWLQPAAFATSGRIARESA